MDEKDGAGGDVGGVVGGGKIVQIAAGLQADEAQRDGDQGIIQGRAKGETDGGSGEAAETVVAAEDREGVERAAFAGGIGGGGEEGCAAGIDADGYDAARFLGMILAQPADGSEDVTAFAVAEGIDLAFAVALAAEIEAEDVISAAEELAGEGDVTSLSAPCSGADEERVVSPGGAGAVVGLRGGCPEGGEAQAVGGIEEDGSAAASNQGDSFLWMARGR